MICKLKKLILKRGKIKQIFLNLDKSKMEAFLMKIDYFCLKYFAESKKNIIRGNKKILNIYWKLIIIIFFGNYIFHIIYRL